MKGARRSRARKRHVQLDMLNAAGTKPVPKHGGKRRGAGRPPKGKRAGSSHKCRHAIKPSQPVHVVLRVLPVMGQLRKRSMYQALRGATIAVLKGSERDGRDDFRIVHLSIQQNHVHLLVEAQNKQALSKGMQAFEISAAKLMNKALGWPKRRRGQVFEDRYHSEVITTPRQARHALAYVLNNWRKHQQDRGALSRTWLVDPFSSGASFWGWKQLEGRDFMWKTPETYDSLIVWFPKTWLLQEGWLKYGRIDCREVPSKNQLAPRTKVRT